MALRGIKPTAVQKRLKALFYGGAGVGKTTASIQFPRPYLIDTEKGASNDQYVKLLEKNGGALFQTCDFDELLKEVTALLTEKHEYKTLIIDPLTTLYNNLLDICAEKIKKTSREKDVTGTEFGRHYSEANKKMKHLLNLLIRLDMNVIITSHAKNEYGSKMEVLGQTFDCYKKLDYLFDLVFEIQKLGKKRLGYVKKTRIETFEDGSSFDFSYDAIAERYGKEILEKDCIAETLATKEQVNRFKELVAETGYTEETVFKWLEKAQASCVEEFSEETIKKLINHLETKTKKFTFEDVPQ